MSKGVLIPQISKGVVMTTQLNKEEFNVGDYVTLCQTEFDGNEFDGIWRIQILIGNFCFVTTVEDYVEIDPENPPKTITVYPEHVELEELSKATDEEIQSGQRAWDDLV